MAIRPPSSPQEGLIQPLGSSPGALLMAKDRPQLGRIDLSASNSLHPLPKVLQTQAIVFSHT